MMLRSIQSKDWERIELFFKSGCSIDRVACASGLDLASFRRLLTERYGESYESVIKGFKVMGELLIEATQFKRALSGNTTLLLMLGRLRCNQSYAADSTPPADELIHAQQECMRLNHQISALEAELNKCGASSKSVNKVKFNDI